MKYLLDEKGNIVAKDGKPTVIDDDGKEFAIDAINAQKTITQLHAEAAEHRKKASANAKLLEQFEGIDPVAAKDAITQVASLGDNHKLEVEKLKTALNTTWQEKLEAEQKVNKELSDKLYSATVLSKFATSDIVKKTVLTPDIAAKVFGAHFDADGVAKDAKGNVIYSKEKPGEAAGFDEALTLILEQYPSKDAILRSSLSGSGAPGSGGGHLGADFAKFFDKKSPEYSITEQSKLANSNPQLYTQLKAAHN
jgi:hypothetical protein